MAGGTGVLLVSRNGLALTKRAIKSVLAQDHPGGGPGD